MPHACLDLTSQRPVKGVQSRLSRHIDSVYAVADENFILILIYKTDNIMSLPDRQSK